TPVRGSVDAGQPADVHYLNSMLALVAAKENKSPPKDELQINHTNVITKLVTDKNDELSIDKGCGNNTRTQKSSTTSSATVIAGATITTTMTASKPSINVTTNPLDISLCGAQPPCGTTQSTAGVKGRGKLP
ncbi:hypothetical protein PV326_012826, partial [Microctonus aethiopoides]